MLKGAAGIDGGWTWKFGDGITRGRDAAWAWLGDRQHSQHGNGLESSAFLGLARYGGSTSRLGARTRLASKKKRTLVWAGRRHTATSSAKLEPARQMHPCCRPLSFVYLLPAFPALTVQ